MAFERRIARRTFCGALGLGAFRVLAGAANATAFALIGDEPHNPAYIRSGLTRTLVEGIGLSIDFTDEEGMLTYETLRRYKVFIMFRDGYRRPNGYWRPVVSGDKVIQAQADLVSVPPIQRKIGDGPVPWISAEQG